MRASPVRLVFLSILLSGFVGGSAAAETPKPFRCADAEYRRLDFWAGDWDAYEADDPAKPIARTHVDVILGGCALLETYEQTDGLVGEAFTLYDASRKVWHHTWVNNGGGLMVLEGSFEDAILTLRGPLTSRDGRQKTVRDVWFVQKDGGVRETAHTSVDGGATWQVFFDVVFRPHKPAKAARANP